MEVILLEKVENLGNLGDKVTVKPGYGRNYLIPGGKAKPATEANLAEFEARRAELEKAAQEALDAAIARKEAVEKLTVTINSKAGDEGKLFGSIGPVDIADAVKAAGVDVEKKEVRLPEGPLRLLGEYDIDLHLHTDVNATVKVVVAEEA